VSTPFLDRLARRSQVDDGVVVGDRVQVGRGSRLETRASLTVGDEVSIGKSCRIDAIGVIGDRCLIGNGVVVTGTGVVELDGDNWIGAGATLVAPVKLGKGAVVAPHSVVTGEVPPMTIASGNPGTVIGARFSDDVLRNDQDDRLLAQG
jgi:acetyltransferase-like isoleucine patch superfamily enzyme